MWFQIGKKSFNSDIILSIEPGETRSPPFSYSILAHLTNGDPQLIASFKTIEERDKCYDSLMKLLGITNLF